MKNLYFAIFTASGLYSSNAFGSEAGMPQLNPEFWASQVFWLILTFSSLYLVVWKFFLPKITYSIENRKSKVANNLDEVQKLKENAEKKLLEYKNIIEITKREAKKIVDDSRKKLNEDLNNKKKEFNTEIEKELLVVEKEIYELKKSSISNISKIASETSSEVIKKIIDIDVNKSNVSAIVDEIVKKNTESYI